MMPDDSKYYVSNFLSSTISVIDLTTPHPTLIKNIDLLVNYDALTGTTSGGTAHFRSRRRSARTASGSSPRTR
jgi:hypothetical protein